MGHNGEMRMPREVMDGEGTTWSCVEAYAGLSEDGKSDAARVEGTDRFRVVCTPSGGATSVRLELPGGWSESMTDADLLREIQSAAS
ncbi:MAG TPA: hypothetical protein VK358_06555 [Longimicrobium sp.]|nr:hypothetical protein [Longimicrobium sp.]